MNYILVTCDGVDQVCDELAQAKSEKKDLEAMGFKVKVINCPKRYVDQVCDMLELGASVTSVHKAIAKMITG